MDKTSDMPQSKPLETSSPEPEIPAKPPSKLPFIVGGIILLIIGVAGGWYYGQNAMKSDAMMPTPSPVQETTEKVGLVEKSMDLYDITLQIPANWSFSEVNRRPEPTPLVPGMTSPLGHDCAEYEVQNELKTLKLLIVPTCGYTDGGADNVPKPYTTVKNYSNGDIIARYFDTTSNKYYYVDAGNARISDSTGEHLVLMQNGHIGVGPGEEHNVNITLLTITAVYTGPESEKESQLSLADQVVASIETSSVSPTEVSSNVQTFSSENLGIMFSYLKSVSDSTIYTYETEKKVYIHSSDMNPQDGQYVEVFTKDPNETLADAITRQNLIVKNPEQCAVEISEDTQEFTGGDFVRAEIVLPNTDRSNFEEVQKMTTACAPDYGPVNGIRFFLMDKNTPDTYLFFDIGQYSFIAENNKTWYQTIELLN